MGHTGSGRGYRDAATGDGAASPDYRETFKVGTENGYVRSPEQWARDVFEGAPRAVRWFLLIGWRAILGLRLGPRSSPDHILGWRIAAREPDAIRLELRSALMTAELVLRLPDSMAALTTSVYYIRRAARPLWTVVLPYTSADDSLPPRACCLAFVAGHELSTRRP